MDVARKLISHGAVKPRDRELVAVFRDALDESNCAIIRLLIEFDKDSILRNSTTTFESPPFHAAAHRDDIDFAKFLIASGFEVPQPTLNDEPVIYVAIENANLSMIEFLLKDNGHLESKEVKLVQFALDNSDKTTATFLIQKGVKFDRQDALNQVVEDGARHSLVKIILDQADEKGEKLNLDDALTGILGRDNEETCDLLFDRVLTQIHESTRGIQYCISPRTLTAHENSSAVEHILKQETMTRQRHCSGLEVWK